MEKSQPNEPIPSFGKQLTHEHLEKHELCYAATATGLTVKFNCQRTKFHLGDKNCQKVQKGVPAIKFQSVDRFQQST
jgi:hypothetical protein